MLGMSSSTSGLCITSLNCLTSLWNCQDLVNRMDDTVRSKNVGFDDLGVVDKEVIAVKSELQFGSLHSFHASELPIFLRSFLRTDPSTA